MIEQRPPVHTRSRVRAAIGRTAQAVAAWSEGATNLESGPPELTSLRPKFIPAQHQTYVDYISKAVEEDGVCNIALTGRYGAGKSSVLNEFAAQHEGRVLFLSLSTLGPETEGESRTQQIQKELVKQLLHREKPSRLPQSRYQRIDRLPRRRAFLQAALTLSSLALIAWLFGVLPDLPLLQGDRPLYVRIAAAVGGALACTVILAWVRLSVHNRLEVAGVSAAGASVTLAKKSESYFDQYLDEIVYFFETMRNVDIVVFEDLDRFDDAGIFENLRELNTLLNSSKQSSAGRLLRRRRTIRFVYALRDSIFQELGYDTVELAQEDAATAEAARANRTKFFDIVIPIVPFITHRTARELLSTLLNDPKATVVPKVSDDLVDLIARHTPDMRLLINIRNEYAVFAQRLINEQKGMESLEPDQLFAMVAYKNIHLADFEDMLLGRSSLDRAYDDSRLLVTKAIADRRNRLRLVRNSRAFYDSLAYQAEVWGKRLDWLFDDMVGGGPRSSFQRYGIEKEAVEEESTSEEFWLRILEANKGIDGLIHYQPYNESKWFHLSMDELQRQLGSRLTPEVLNQGARTTLVTEESQLIADLALLRTADFKELCERTDFTLESGSDGGTRSFTTLVRSHIKSELGQALVAQGYINRYYTLIVAQYYGERVPPNAMNFMSTTSIRMSLISTTPSAVQTLMLF